MMPMLQLHVNAVTGHDINNDGLSEGSPVKTLAKALQIGNWRHEIFLQSNINGEGPSRWRELLTPVPGARVRALGDAAPLVDAFDVAPNASFTPVDGRPGIYQISWTHSVEISTSTVFSARIGGEAVRRAASLDALEDMTTSGLYPGAVSSSPQTIYMRAPDGGDLRDESYVVEIIARNYAVLGAPALRMSGIDFRGCAHNDGVGVFSGFSRITGCSFRDGTKHNLFMSGRSLFRDILCEDGDPSYGGASPGAGASSLYVAYGSPGLDLDIENCIARRGYVFPEHATNQSVALYAHTTDDVGGQWERIRIAGFRAESVGSTISAARSQFINWQVSGVVEVDVHEPGYPS